MTSMPMHVTQILVQETLRTINLVSAVWSPKRNFSKRLRQTVVPWEILTGELSIKTEIVGIFFQAECYAVWEALRVYGDNMNQWQVTR
jgi:hypothetical protein